MKQIIHIVGNRPQFIKLAVLHQAIAKTGLSQKIIHSGQHFSDEMSGIFFKQLHIPAPDISLSPPAAASPDLFIGETATALQQVISSYTAGSMVVAYGDTNTTLAAALAASRAGYPLAHVEAGIRTNDMRMPEELNRVLTDRLATVNYCCTQKNSDTLLAEGYGSAVSSRVVLAGDLMLDAFMQLPASPTLYGAGKDYVACTIHRAENILVKENLSAIIAALNKIHAQVPVLMPLHPHTQKKIAEFGLSPAFERLAPLGYGEMKALLQQSSFVITDSGGAARESFFSRKKSVVIMQQPFWPEIMEAGCSIRSDANADAILQSFRALPTLDATFQTPIFGTGNAAAQIARDIAGYF